MCSKLTHSYAGQYIEEREGNERSGKEELEMEEKKRKWSKKEKVGKVPGVKKWRRKKSESEWKLIWKRKKLGRKRNREGKGQ
jgi:hypothetical protein